MLIVWPDQGSTTSPEVAMLRFMSSAGSRQGSSSSPVRISVGVSIFSMPSTSSQSDGRFICTPRMVSAWPFDEPSRNCCANSAQPRGSLFWNCTRVGPRAYLRAASAQFASNEAAAASHSARNLSFLSGSAP